MAIVFGLLSAMSWGSSAIVAALLARRLGALEALFWLQLASMCVVAPFALAQAPPDVSTGTWLLAAASGATYLLGAGFWNAGDRRGDVGIVTTQVETDGAFAALVSILLGESLSTAAVVALAVVCFGVVASTRAPSSHGRLTAAAIAFGLLGSVSFGSTFVLGGHAAALGVAWTLLCSRATGVVAMTPFALARRTPLPRGSLRILALMAIGDVGGYGFLLLGAADSIAIASVIASQYALIAVVLSRFAFHERLSRFQAVGIALTMVGVAAVSLVGAS